MNRLILAASAACVAWAAPAFAQSTPGAPDSAPQQPATTFSSAAIAQNFQYINHPPPPPAPASSVTSTGSGRGHRHRQMSGSSDSGG
ncbi:hypothetical protein GXB81_27770 [Paraburkholderia sp. Ac-20336]|uniref:hypothetical protein n=1 Tax=Burkholderiaceae TaxID=119060 RepID=UPI00141F9BC0|nr:MULTISPECIES: hypothetical protein [Burkholderiaceae]MBN3806818.1 hypothetical protein [Paraburkholderia sp. Ac-20336]MBN3850342.1 hypothetical protein [Paraburkholderia sp. Ac-20342]NIF52721.1 hypothetical protein [Burkholderia sp. Ax-1724]NIF76231.1 hypothetical protein [Paraburkholderia sp. Cy-641]